MSNTPAQEQAAVKKWMKELGFERDKDGDFWHEGKRLYASLDTATFFYRSEQAACQKAVEEEKHEATKLLSDKRLTERAGIEAQIQALQKVAGYPKNRYKTDTHDLTRFVNEEIRTLKAQLVKIDGGSDGTI